jgi:hypothetical protein
MAYYRLVTPQGHFAPGTVVTDTDSEAGPFRIAPQTAQRLLEQGALERLPESGQSADEPGWTAVAVRTAHARSRTPKEH